MDVVARTSDRPLVTGASKYCSECGSALAADAVACATCGKAALAGTVASFMPPFRSIPESIWAGALEVFFAITTLIATLLSGVTSALNGFGQSFLGPGSSSGTSLMLLGILSLAQLAVQVALISGLLAQRRWARPLYLWTLGPIVIITLIMVVQGEVLKGTAGFVAGVLWLGLTALQAMFVVRSEKEFTN